MLKTKQTSTTATKVAAITAKAFPAWKVGPPHWNGYGNLILHVMEQRLDSVSDPQVSNRGEK